MATRGGEKMKTIKKFVYKISDAFGVISAVGYLAIIVICVMDVALEKILDTPVLGSYELVERCMLVAVFASFGYAQSRKAHINMTIVIEKFKRIPRLLTLGFMSVISVASTGYAANAAWTMWISSQELGQETGILHIPLWPFYLIESLAMYFFALVLCLDTIFIFIGLKNDEINDEITSDYGMMLTGKEAKPTQSPLPFDVDDIPLG
jgi:TRAP-type C4-dicarboxylate transport system permease small subunit